MVGPWILLHEKQWVLDAGSPEDLEKIIAAVNDVINQPNGSDEMAGAADVRLGLLGVWDDDVAAKYCYYLNLDDD